MKLGQKSAKLRILDAAATAFAEHGVDQTSIDDIARILGATKGKIYHHFGSKGELVCAIRKHSVQLTLKRVRPYFETDTPPSKKFHKMAKAHVVAMISELAYHRVVVEEMRGSGTGTVTDKERQVRVEITALQSEYGRVSGSRSVPDCAQLSHDAPCTNLLVSTARTAKQPDHCNPVGGYGLGRSGISSSQRFRISHLKIN